MSRLLENRVAKLEDRRRGAGRFDDWTDERLMERLVELNETIISFGRLFEELIASHPDLSEVEKGQAIALHHQYSPYQAGSRIEEI